MSTFDLKSFEELYLRQIVKKFSFSSGAKFYRSCRGAKDFCDLVKPCWPLPDTRLEYGGTTRAIKRGNKNIPFEFLRIQTVIINPCNADTIKTLVLPEVSSMRGIELLCMYHRLSDEDTKSLLEATKPKTIVAAFGDRHQYEYDVTSEVFKNIKNLRIMVKPGSEAYFSTTNRIFEVGANRKTLFLYYRFHIEMVVHFLKNWLRGESTGSLQKLTLFLSFHRFRRETLEKFLYFTEIQKLVKNYVNTSDGLIIERMDHARLLMTFSDRCIEFQFL